MDEAILYARTGVIYGSRPRMVRFVFFLLCISFPCFGRDQYCLDHAIVSIYALDTRTNKVLVSKNSHLSLVPASCMKLVTTAAALSILGEKNRFATYLEYEGEIDSNHVLQGNLYVRGTGDPSLGSDRIIGTLSWQKQIEEWTDAIIQLGIREIEGKVVGDATHWEKALAGSSWSWEDLGNYYGAGACALSFHENYYSLIFQPGKQISSGALIVRTDPPVDRLILQNEVLTGKEGSGDCACIYGSEFSWIQWVRGTIPLGVESFAIKGAIPDPALFAADLLTKGLKEKNMSVKNRSLQPMSKRQTFHTTYSPTIAEIVHWTNQKSINLYAEHLLKKMGEEMEQKGSTSAGIQAVKNFWLSHNIDLEGFQMADGCGLSRKNLITASQLVQMLIEMKTSAFFPVFLGSLPNISPTIRAKSGSMSLVKAYAGYAGPIVFAILVNQCTNAQKMKQMFDRFFLQLEEWQQ